GAEEEGGEVSKEAAARKSLPATHSSIHGMAQFMAVTSSAPAGLPAPDFFGTNFAVSGSLGGNFEMAFIGQRGVGDLAPQRLAAVATVRPGAGPQITAVVGYGPGRPSPPPPPDTHSHHRPPPRPTTRPT